MALGLYLVVAPLLSGSLGAGATWIVAVPAVALGAFGAGAAAASRTPHLRKTSGRRLEFKTWFLAAFASLSVLYFLFIAVSGQLERRVTSEVAAKRASNFNFGDFSSRVFELGFWPCVVLIAYSALERRQTPSLYVIVAASVGWIGLGIQNSRWQLATPFLLAFVFFINSRRSSSNRAAWAYFGLLAVGCSAVLALTFLRDRALGFSYAVRHHLIERLDGLNLVDQVLRRNDTVIWGTWNPEMFRYMVSYNPFAQESSALKFAGLTSTKQWVLSNVLHSGSIDAPNSLVLDPLYFGGLGLLALCFLALGSACQVFDRSARSGSWTTNRYATALFLAFGVTAATIVEKDMFGYIIRGSEVWLICVAIMWAGVKVEVKEDLGRIE